MAKRFCVTGTCIPEKNYMIDISDRIEQIIERYIQQGQYFTMNQNGFFIDKTRGIC